MASDQFRAGARVLARMGLTLEGWAYHPQLPELAAFAKAVPELTKQYADLGIAFETRTPEQFSELIRQDLDRWGPVMKSMNLQLD